MSQADSLGIYSQLAAGAGQLYSVQLFVQSAAMCTVSSCLYSQQLSIIVFVAAALFLPVHYMPHTQYGGPIDYKTNMADLCQTQFRMV